MDIAMAAMLLKVYVKTTTGFKFFCSTYLSGQAAVITPRQVIHGLGSRRVKAVAAAKHHTVIATEGGDVFTWGSNRGTTLLGFLFLPELDLNLRECM